MWVKFDVTVSVNQCQLETYKLIFPNKIVYCKVHLSLQKVNDSAYYIWPNILESLICPIPTITCDMCFIRLLHSQCQAQIADIVIDGDNKEINGFILWSREIMG